MLEFYLRSTRGIARARSSLVGPYLDGFAAALRELGYCRLVAQWCITYAVHLGLWAAAEDVALAALDKEAVQAFLAHLSRCRCPGHRAGRHGVARARTAVFVRYLRARGIVPVPAPPAAPPTLVAEFCEWMRSQRGSAETTLRQYQAVAIALLGRLGDDPARYEAGTVRAAVHEVTGGHGTPTARFVAKVARGFLRYLAATGRCRPGLDAAILAAARWRHASLPRYVSAESVQRRAPADGTAPAFVSLAGMRLSYGGFRKAWLLVLARAGLSAPPGGRRARVHDIRHTFAARALESAPEQRDRIAKHMLAVSTYLGHSCVADTYWYFQTTPTLMAQVADACQRHFEGEQS